MKLRVMQYCVFLSCESITPQYSTYYEGEWKQGLLFQHLQLFWTQASIHTHTRLHTHAHTHTHTRTHNTYTPQEVTTGE